MEIFTLIAFGAGIFWLFSAAANLGSQDFDNSLNSEDENNFYGASYDDSDSYGLYSGGTDDDSDSYGLYSGGTDDEDMCPSVNPANGMPMVNCSIDVLGNPYGTDSSFDDGLDLSSSFDDPFDSFNSFDDDWS